MFNIPYFKKCHLIELCIQLLKGNKISHFRTIRFTIRLQDDEMQWLKFRLEIVQWSELLLIMFCEQRAIVSVFSEAKVIQVPEQMES